MQSNDKEPSYFWEKLKGLLIILMILYILWGLGWYWVTPVGLREMPLFIPFVVFVGLTNMLCLPFEAFFNTEISTPIIVGFSHLLDAIGIFDIINNFGHFEKK